MTQNIRILDIVRCGDYDTVFASADGRDFQIVTECDLVSRDWIGLTVLFSNEDGCEFVMETAEHRVVEDEDCGESEIE